MKRPMWMALLSFLGVVALFGVMDLVWTQIDGRTWGEIFTSPFHLAIMAAVGAVQAACTFFSVKKNAVSARA